MRVAELRKIIGAFAIVSFLASGCATPVGVTRVGEKSAFRAQNSNVLSSGEPSDYSTQILERLALGDQFKSQPELALAELNSGLGKPDERDRLFALSELSFAYAEDSGKQSYYLASAAYAYAFLFPRDQADQPGPYDQRLRLAVDLYNWGIALGLATKDGKEVDLTARRLSLPFGTLDLSVDPKEFHYKGYRLTKFVPLAEFEARGLRSTCRQAGIGAALSAGVEPREHAKASRWIPPTAKVPVTAFLRFDDPRLAMSNGRLNGIVELHRVDQAPTVQIGSYSVPLESDPSLQLAYRLQDSPAWDFEIAGFRRGDLSIFGDTGDEDSDRLFMIRPYQPKLIPVVFVHGTASSPARWAQMTNELLCDPAIASHYQLWFFMYNSGNPILLSAMRLRDSLQALRKDLDPDTNDAAFDQMVVIGHSQGGLLTKMTVVDSGNRFWDIVTPTPFERADLDPETRALVGRAMFIKPLPFVKTVVFIATPHRGSFLARDAFVKLGDKFLNLPAGVVKSAVQLANIRKQNPLATPLAIPTALDNQDPSNPFLKTLSTMPIAPGVEAHSIIPVKGDGPIEGGNDGAVEYKSAHIDDVESELVVRSGHSTQGTPQTIEEVRRILYEHVGIR